MNYSIGEVSRMFGLPQSTLRYYDKEGVLPQIQRQGAGIRRFDEQAVEALRVIECLKKSGMEIKDIRQFMIWCGEGASTYQQRLELFQRRRAEVEQELARLKKTLAMIDFKCWYYTQASHRKRGFYRRHSGGTAGGDPSALRCLPRRRILRQKRDKLTRWDYKGGAICRSGNFYRLRNS